MQLRIIRKALDNHSQLTYEADMIHCVCRQLNTAKVDEAASCGARSPKCVLAHHGHTFNCGKCASSIRDRLSELAETASVTPAAPSLPRPAHDLIAAKI